MNWAVNAWLYAEEQNIPRNSSKCTPYNSTPTSANELDFLLGVHCLERFGGLRRIAYSNFTIEEDGDLLGKHEINSINNGTCMIYAIPFGNLEDPDADVAQGVLGRIHGDDYLNCGVVVPDNFVGDLHEATGVVGMSVTYCTAVAVAIKNGKTDGVELFPFFESSNVSYQALHNGTVDILAGAKANLEYDMGSADMPGVTFSTPYFYGNETAEEDLTMYTLATREDDFEFSSFVNLVVMSTIKADRDGIGQGTSKNMPLVSGKMAIVNDS